VIENVLKKLATWNRKFKYVGNRLVPCVHARADRVLVAVVRGALQSACARSHMSHPAEHGKRARDRTLVRVGYGP
jgi:hypothetical protein